MCVSASSRLRFVVACLLASAVSCVFAVVSASAAETVGPAVYEVRGPGLALKLSGQGEIVGAVLGPKAVEWPLVGRTALADCQRSGEVAAARLGDGGVEFRCMLVHCTTNARCALVERFRPTADSVRWEIELKADGPPWSTAIGTQLHRPATPQSRFWTAWSDPEQRDDGWRDPLEMRRPADRVWSYQGEWVAGDNIAIPLATTAETAADAGLSLALSPQDTLLDLRLSTRQNGEIVFSRRRHRLGEGKPLRFAMDLVAHEADWRGGLRWMVRRYPQFFDPPNPKADQMAGCGAYSADERPIDVAKMRRMAFRINWKSSEDFPYIGMFLPPVDGEYFRWQRQEEKPPIPGKSPLQSFKDMNDYCRRMRQDGFYVLSYFNVTEFGARMKYPAPARKATGDADLWKEPNDYLYAKFPEAILLHKGRPIRTYCGAYVVDPGDPAYRRFLLEQARRHIEKLPDSAGLCIDRLDWLDRYNQRADDGASWVDGRPARSLFLSWQELMAKLGPLMHDADKVIFANSLRMRLELLGQVDGIFCELRKTPRGQGPAINGNALLGVRKPVLLWTFAENWLKPDADEFFQRHMHLGVFPTAPYPGNHHSILPSEFADRQYEEYGPLLDVLRGKKWVLLPHVVEIAGGAAKVNLFETPAGYAMPVTFAGGAAKVRATIRGLPKLTKDAICAALHPGSDKWIPIVPAVEDGVASLEVPLKRGCAMVRMRNCASPPSK
jgi:hypothetical protein